MIHLRVPVGHGYTQIVSKMGFTHGQLQIESETYPFDCLIPSKSIQKYLHFLYVVENICVHVLMLK